jgi:hypothetical protein
MRPNVWGDAFPAFPVRRVASRWQIPPSTNTPEWRFAKPLTKESNMLSIHQQVKRKPTSLLMKLYEVCEGFRSRKGKSVRFHHRKPHYPSGPISPAFREGNFGLKEGLNSANEESPAEDRVFPCLIFAVKPESVKSRSRITFRRA